MIRTTTLIVLAMAAVLTAAPAAAQGNPFGSCQDQQPIRMQGQTAEPIEGRPGAVRITWTGAPVIIVCGTTTLQANRVVYEEDTRNITAIGDVVVIQPDLILHAQRADMNGETKLGTFQNAAGWSRIGERPGEKSQFGTLEPDVFFYGEVVEKTGPKTYRLHHGGFTTCVQPTPRWDMTSSDATITLDERALLRNVILRVKNVPLLYLPVIYYPMNKEDRSTGFLLPTYGSSTLRGTTLSNAFFLAISRSQDATFFHDWTSKAGQGFGSEYRYVASPDSNGRANFYMFDTPARFDEAGEPLEGPRRSYRLEGRTNNGLPGNFRLLGHVDYFTDASTQQIYQNVYDTQQQRSFGASLTGRLGRRYRLAVTADQRDSFYNASGQRNGRLPAINLTMADQAIGPTRIYAGASGEAVYLVRQNEIGNPDTDHSLWRFDGGPHVRMPLSNLPFLTATADASWRITHWMESLDPEGQQVPVDLTRQLVQARVRVTGPTFARVFDMTGSGYADRIKHVIEPKFSISRTSAFRELDRVVRLDYSVDGQVGGVTQIDYGVDNSVLARLAGPPSPPGAPPRPGVTRQILTVSIYQSYYSNALAAGSDSQYQGTSRPGRFSPLRIQAAARPTESVTGDFGMEIDAKSRAVTVLNASGRIDLPSTQVSINWAKRRRIPDLPGYEIGTQFLGGTATVHTRTNHLGGSYRFNYDIGNRNWIQQRISAYYNAQCCGISFDWQSVDTPLWNASGVPTNRQFAVSFTLAGVGSFSNPLGSFGGR